MRIRLKARYFLFSLDVHHYSLRDADLRSQPVVISAAVQVRRVGPADRARPGYDLAEAKLSRPRIRKGWKTRYFLFSLDALHRRVGLNAQRVLSGELQVRRVDPADQAKLLKEERAHPVIDRAREVGEATDDAYFIFGYNQATGGVFVWRVGGGKSPQADARYKALATSEVPVTVLDALVSWKQAKSVMDAVVRDAQALRAEGIMLNSAGVESEGILDGVRPGRVEIGVRDLTPAQAETLLQRYADSTIGRDKVVVVERADIVPLSSGRR
jgi:hypothetical protein